MKFMQSNTPFKINDYVTGVNTESLPIYIVNGIVESGGEHLTNAHIKYYEPNSTFEGARFYEAISFSDDDYILIGHKCHMTLVDVGDKYIATSIFVHPSMRNRGYAKSFLEQRFITTKPIEIDTKIEGLKETIRRNSVLHLFK